MSVRIARIVEADCIGCTKCLRVCPVDAIVGAAGQLHTVLVEHCTGCEQCLAPCPVDCIELVAAPYVWDGARAGAALARERARTERLARRHRDRGAPGIGAEIPAFDPCAAEAQIRAAIARSEARRRDRRESSAAPEAP